MAPDYYENITNIHDTRILPKYYQCSLYQNVSNMLLDPDTRKLPKNYQDIQYTPEITCGALYVILLNCGSSFVGIELCYNKVDRVFVPELLLTELSWELKIMGKNAY